MLVDDDAVCLRLGREILGEKYCLYPVQSGEDAFSVLRKVTPDLILLDIEMPGMDGHEVLRRLKAAPATRDVPVIFLTARNGPADELDGLSLGAIDFVTKPFSPSLLIRRIENHLSVGLRKRELLRHDEELRRKLAGEIARKALRRGLDPELVREITGLDPEALGGSGRTEAAVSGAPGDGAPVSRASVSGT